MHAHTLHRGSLGGADRRAASPATARVRCVRVGKRTLLELIVDSVKKSATTSIWVTMRRWRVAPTTARPARSDGRSQLALPPLSKSLISHIHDTPRSPRPYSETAALYLRYTSTPFTLPQHLRSLVTTHLRPATAHRMYTLHGSHDFRISFLASPECSSDRLYLVTQNIHLHDHVQLI